MKAGNSELLKIASALSLGVENISNVSKSSKMTMKDCEKQQPRSAVVQILLGLIANFTSLAPSMSLGFSAIALPALLADYNPNKLDDNQASWVASIASIATPIGCFISGPILDKCGRKVALIVVNIVCLLGWLVIVLAYYIPQYQYIILLIGRIITGLSTGLSSTPAVVYMAEISTPNLRGMFTTWNATSFSLGVLIIYALGWIFKDNWGIAAAISSLFPCIGLVLIVIFLSESPSWLISKNRIEEAKTSMCRIFGTKYYNQSVEDEIETLILNREKSKLNEKSTNTKESPFVRNIKFLLQPSSLKPFILILAYFFFQQFSGVFVVVFYAVDIVKEVKITIDPYLAICLIAATRLVASVIVGLVSKKFGRRPLSLLSGGGMTLCMIMLAGYLVLIDEGTITSDLLNTLGWLPIMLLMVYFFTSTLGFLTMPFAMAAEVFPSRIRGIATGLNTCFAYVFNFIIVKVYPMMIKEMGSYKVFFFYGAVSLLGTIFIVLFLPETKGKTLQEIEEYFGRKKHNKNNKNNNTIEMDEEAAFKINSA